jgi:hypothetical protein
VCPTLVEVTTSPYVHVGVVDRGLLGILNRILCARGRGHGRQGKQ